MSCTVSLYLDDYCPMGHVKNNFSAGKNKCLLQTNLVGLQ
jgi:hypothetical protein